MQVIWQYLAMAWVMFKAHPEFSVPLVGAIIVWATKKRSAEAYATMAARWPTPVWSRIAALTQLLAAVFPDPIKARKAGIKFIFGIVEEKTSDDPKPTAGAAPTSKGGPLAFLLVAGVVCTALPNEGCKQALAVMDAYEILAPKIRCGIENQDLPREEMFKRCAVALYEQPFVEDAVGASRAAGAKHAADAAAVAGAKACEPKKSLGPNDF